MTMLYAVPVAAPRRTENSISELQVGLGVQMRFVRMFERRSEGRVPTVRVLDCGVPAVVVRVAVVVPRLPGRTEIAAGATDRVYANGGGGGGGVPGGGGGVPGGGGGVPGGGDVDVAAAPTLNCLQLTGALHVCPVTAPVFESVLL